MYAHIDLKEVTDRVLGIAMPRVAMPVRIPRPWDAKMGVVLLMCSALASAVSFALWTGGDTHLALHVFAGTALALALAVRLL